MDDDADGAKLIFVMAAMLMGMTMMMMMTAYSYRTKKLNDDWDDGGDRGDSGEDDAGSAS